MLAEDQGVVTSDLGVEDGVAVVCIGKAARDVELALHATEVSCIADIFVRAALLAKKVIWDVFDGIETQPVCLGAIHKPADVANERGVYILGVGGRVRGEILERDISKADIISISIEAVVFGIVRMTDEGILGMVIALVATKVCVRGLVGDVDQVGEAEVLHLPGGAPVAGVVPFSVESVFGDTEVEILRSHTRIDIDGCILVESRHIESAVVHDVVEIDADAEAVCCCDELQ